MATALQFRQSGLRYHLKSRVDSDAFAPITMLDLEPSERAFTTGVTKEVSEPDGLH